MSGIDENGNEIHYDGYFSSGSYLNPDSLKDAMNNVNNKEYFDSIICTKNKVSLMLQMSEST